MAHAETQRRNGGERDGACKAAPHPQGAAVHEGLVLTLRVLSASA